MISKTWACGAVPLFLGMMLVAGTTAFAGEYTIADIRSMRPDDLKAVAFVVSEDMDVHIDAVGGRHRNADWMFAYPWLIDATTREVVWAMEKGFSSRRTGSPYLYKMEDDIRLPRGTYELYYFAGRLRYFGSNLKIEDLGDLKELVKDWFGKADEQLSDRELVDECYVELTSDSDTFSKLPQVPGPAAAAVELIHPDNDQYLQAGFVLDREIEVQVYAAGEYSEWSDVAVDWGWIADADDRERVWEMDRWNSDWAGGAEKNRVSREQVTLPAGRYIAYYVTDDSHTYGQWNDSPPYDPEAWGLRISAVSPADAAVIRPADVGLDEIAFIAITQVCDNEFFSEGFRLSTTADVHLYAIGEDDRYNDGLADYAWINEAKTGERIWVMDDDNTRYAGGAEKNRMFDDVITLEEGEYIIHYVSDGSHSYCDWNTSPPYDQKSYGVTLSLAGGNVDKNIFTRFEPSEGPSDALVALTCVGDDERRKQRFTLEKVTRVRIQALGEGDDDEMYDYGWIEDANDGTIAWEMTFRKTRYAGGAKKNREVDQQILLDKGSYIVYYVTDGSHSCNDWNADSPDNPFSWGIVITEVK
jgi:hypothetical protein